MTSLCKITPKVSKKYLILTAVSHLNIGVGRGVVVVRPALVHWSGSGWRRRGLLVRWRWSLRRTSGAAGTVNTAVRKLLPQR